MAVSDDSGQSFFFCCCSDSGCRALTLLFLRTKMFQMRETCFFSLGREYCKIDKGWWLSYYCCLNLNYGDSKDPSGGEWLFSSNAKAVVVKPFELHCLRSSFFFRPWLPSAARRKSRSSSWAPKRRLRPGWPTRDVHGRPRDTHGQVASLHRRRDCQGVHRLVSIHLFLRRICLHDQSQFYWSPWVRGSFHIGAWSVATASFQSFAAKTYDYLGLWSWRWLIFHSRPFRINLESISLFSCSSHYSVESIVCCCLCCS